MRSYRTTDLLALILLLAGGVAVPVAGWVAGVVLLWASPSWSRRGKVLGTAVVPGGLAAPLLLLSVPMGTARCRQFAAVDGTVLAERCAAVDGFRLPAWLGLTAFGLLVLAPIVSAWVLLRRLRTPPAGAPPAAGRGSGRAPRLSADVP